MHCSFVESTIYSPVKINLTFQVQLVRTIKLCVDYRSLNEKTIDDQHPLPCIMAKVFGLFRRQLRVQCLDQGKVYFTW